MFRLCAVLVILTAVNVLMVQGSRCFKDGRIGVCMELTKCKVSLRALEECRLMPQRCKTGFQNQEVCCPKFPVKIKQRPIDYSCSTNKYSRRLLGMAVTNHTLYPHAAALGYVDRGSRQYSWRCGGTLIHPRYVLTAAHCFESRPKVVLLGVSDVFDAENPYAQMRAVASIKPHEEYQPLNKINDIGLVRLKEAIEETIYVNPACLLTAENSRVAEVTAIGWGVGSSDAVQVTNKEMILREAKLNLVKCLDHQKGVNIFCARGKSDAACEGDSGSPLHVYIPENRKLYVVGVYSSGPSRCSNAVPARFTSLTPYLDWIEKQVWTVERCVYEKGLQQ